MLKRYSACSMSESDTDHSDVELVDNEPSSKPVVQTDSNSVFRRRTTDIRRSFSNAEARNSTVVVRNSVTRSVHFETPIRRSRLSTERESASPLASIARPSLMNTAALMLSNGSAVSTTRVSIITMNKSHPRISDNFLKEFLTTHNTYRARHGCPPLRINTFLLNVAEDSAKKIINGEPLGLPSIHTCGRTTYCTSEDHLTGNMPVDTWYQEHTMYDYAANEIEHPIFVENFTQIIWKSTVELGCGIAAMRDGKFIYVVGTYYPRGNVQKEYQKNVLRPISQTIKKDKK